MRFGAFLGLLALVACASCASRAAPVPGAALPPDAALPTPPLDPGHPAPPRSGSASAVQFDNADVYAFSNNGETGDKGGGTFAVLPGGDEDLDSAWVIFKVQLAQDDRPVMINLGSTFATLPGGEDDLELSFWLGAYSFSQARWDWLDPPPASADPVRAGAWKADGTTDVELNSEELRQRYCNLGGEVYLCVLVEPKIRAGAWCGVTVKPSTMACSNKDAAGYFVTEPLPATVTAANGGSTDVTLDIAEGDPGEADRIYIFRRQDSGMSSLRAASTTQGWLELGYVDGGDPDFDDPADVINPMAPPPESGKTYEYYAVAAVLDGNFALRATHLDSASGSLAAVWSEVTLSATQVNSVSLAVISGKPAVVYSDHSQSTSTVYYQQASTAEGASAGEWSAPVLIDASASSNLDGDARLKEVNGTPAVSYVDFADNTLRYKRCSMADGSNVADWPVTPVVISTAGTEIAYGSHGFAVIAGHPAVAYQNRSPSAWQNEGVYVWSTTVGGDNAADWANHVVPLNTQSFDWPSLAEIDGSPAISYYQSTGAVAQQSLQFIHAATSTGDQASDWSAPVDLLTGGGSDWSTLLEVDNYPTVVYFRSSPAELGYLRSISADGTQASDWTQQRFTFPISVQWDPGAGNFGLVGTPPLPVIVAPLSTNAIVQLQSSTLSGADLADWSAAQDTGRSGTYVTVEEVNGKTAIAYRAGSGAPTYAILQ